MNIQAITTYTRKHVFESARFYYSVLWILIGYAIVREVVQKSAWVFWGEKFLMPREIIGILFFLFACCILLSAWFLRNKIEKHAEAINSLSEKKGLSFNLRTKIGHKPYEVFGGILVGLLVSYVLFFIGN